MNTPQKLLLIENDIQLARALHSSLKSSFAKVRVAFDLMTAAGELTSFQPDFLIADSAALQVLGTEVFCRETRKVSPAPILLLADHARISEKVRALNAGADDFLEKSVDTRELIARIQAIWRRYLAPLPGNPAKNEMQAVQYPQLSINLANYTVLCYGQPVDMPPKELELFYFLAKSPNRVFTREQLLDQVWGYDYLGDARTVDVHIKRIREKIRDHKAWSLDTVWGVGYKFTVHYPD